MIIKITSSSVGAMSYISLLKTLVPFIYVVYYQGAEITTKERTHLQLARGYGGVYPPWIQGPAPGKNKGTVVYIMFYDEISGQYLYLE